MGWGQKLVWMEGEAERCNGMYLQHPPNICQCRIDLQPTLILDVLRWCPVQKVVDFWEGPIPGLGSIEEEVSAIEEQVDCRVGRWRKHRSFRVILVTTPSVRGQSHTISTQTKQPTHGGTFSPSNNNRLNETLTLGTNQDQPKSRLQINLFDGSYIRKI